MTIFATLALAMPTNDSGPVWSAITPTLMGCSLMASSRDVPRAKRPGSRWEDAGGLPPAHGVDSLCHETLFEGEKCRSRPGRDTDLRIEALDVVIGSFGGDIELARGFLRRVAGCN